MRIPKEILEKYNVSTLHLDDELGTYQAFLQATDYKIVQQYEALIQGKEPDSKELDETIKWREIAREECRKRTI